MTSGYIQGQQYALHQLRIASVILPPKSAVSSLLSRSGTHAMADAAEEAAPYLSSKALRPQNLPEGLVPDNPAELYRTWYGSVPAGGESPWSSGVRKNILDAGEGATVRPGRIHAKSPTVPAPDIGEADTMLSAQALNKSGQFAVSAA